MSEVHYRIVMIGPSRVGKTSLIATLLAAGERALEGTPVSLVPATSTKRLLDRHKDALYAGLNAGEFTPGTLLGSKDRSLFELSLEGRSEQDTLSLELLDYPGGWTDGGDGQYEEQWKLVKGFLNDATVLVIPVDATVLMESVLVAQHQTARELLEVNAVERVAVEWAKRRADLAHRGEPAQLFLVPVKCESYLADNGGHAEQAAELSKRVKGMYGTLIDRVRGEMGEDVALEVFYCPVDTLGCVEIMSADWDVASDPPAFFGHFRLRPPKVVAPLGMDEVLTKLCEHLMTARSLVIEAEAKGLESDADGKRAKANQDDGFFGNMWNWITNEDQRRAKAAKEAETKVVVANRRIQAVSEAVEQLAGRSEKRRRLVIW